LEIKFKIMKKEKKCDVIIEDKPDTLTILADKSWYVRLWRLVSNPFLYVFTGRLRY